MKILYILASLYEFRHGCWLYRCRIPSKALENRGHQIKMLALGKEIDEEWYQFPDVVIYGRVYHQDPISSLREYKKRGKKIIYDLDDDLWTVNPDNPFQAISKEKKLMYEALLKEADIVTTTTDVLGKRFQRVNKNVVVIPNAVDFEKNFVRRGENQKLKIGYSGASSHWGDVSLITDVLVALQKKYNFDFILQGMCGSPIIAELYSYNYILKQKLEPERRKYYETALEAYEKLRKLNFFHVPFYPPELHSEVLRNLNLDIGLCPLKDNTFNQAKSCVKFYEYASMATATLASRVLPYSKEVNYCAKNTFKDWYRKLEKLIVNKKFREKLTEKQLKFVTEKREIKKVVENWEQVLQS